MSTFGANAEWGDWFMLRTICITLNFFLEDCLETSENHLRSLENAIIIEIVGHDLYALSDFSSKW